MLGTIRHRGLDRFEIYLEDHVGLGNARLSIIDLSIIDLSIGQQPISSEDESPWIVFNGEIFNHRISRRAAVLNCGGGPCRTVGSTWRVHTLRVKPSILPKAVSAAVSAVCWRSGHRRSPRSSILPPLPECAGLYG